VASRGARKDLESSGVKVVQSSELIVVKAVLEEWS
jgi:hypothetical protein